MNNPTTTTLNCPECEVPVETLEDSVIGEILPCAECGCEMEVVSLDPVAVELAPEIEEDWGE